MNEVLNTIKQPNFHHHYCFLLLISGTAPVTVSKEQVQRSRIKNDGVGGVPCPSWRRGGTCSVNLRVRDDDLQR